jgi:galactokinase
MIETKRLRRMKEAFAKSFGKAEGLVLARAPGRVNLIGEHTDYNGGYVLPMAVALDIVVLGRRSGGDRIRLVSLDFDDSAEFAVDDHSFDKSRPWVNYPKGVVKFLLESGVEVKPFDAVVSGTVPIGGGLSSSAAFEVATAKFLLELAGSEMDGVTVAKLARRAENEFVAVQCGIMDPFVSVFAERGKALFIDCRTLDHRAMPLFGDDYEFIIANTMVKHSLGQTAYHDRQGECREGLSTLSDLVGPRETLRDVTDAEYATHRHALRAIVRKRCDHVFGENRRVLSALDAMEHHDPAAFGALMDASHDSLRDDYEVSCRELDALVDAARKVKGVLGSRMTGGGFGGCTVTLIEKRAAPAFIRAVGAEYHKATGLKSEFIRTGAAQGATAEHILPSPPGRGQG